MRQLILFLCVILLSGCCAPEDFPLQPKPKMEVSSPPSIYGQMYRVQVPTLLGSFPRMVTFTIDDHEYIGSYDGGSGNITHFIHSPNCKCYNECTSLDLF